MVRLFYVGERTEFTLNWLPIGGFVRPLGEGHDWGLFGDDSNPEDYDEGHLRGRKNPKKSAYISEREELMARGCAGRNGSCPVNDAKTLAPHFSSWFAGALANVGLSNRILLYRCSYWYSD